MGFGATQQAIQKATGAQVTVYSGGNPDEAIADAPGDWTRIKKENAAAFKNNKIAVLVATKAFGMGIDKPNIRYTVHFGMAHVPRGPVPGGRPRRPRPSARAVNDHLLRVRPGPHQPPPSILRSTSTKCEGASTRRREAAGPPTTSHARSGST